MDNQNIDLSIIMPVYNVSDYIDEAITSILNQTFRNYELIIVDDASNDDTLEKIRKYTDTRIRILTNETNYGKAFCINKALDISVGQYIGFMDGDDYCSREKFRIQIDYLNNNPGISLVGCGINKVTADKRLLYTVCPSDNHDEIVKYYSWKNYASGPSFGLTDATIVGKREVFMQYKFNSQIRYAEYFEFYLKASKHYVFSNVQNALYNYRRVGITSLFIANYKILSVLYHSIKKNETKNHKIISAYILIILKSLSFPLIYISIKLVKREKLH